MSDLPQGAGRERVGSTMNSSGSAVAIKTAISKLTASVGRGESRQWSRYFAIGVV